MARLLEDIGSEDEFPDLEELVATRGLGVKKSVSSREKSARPGALKTENGDTGTQDEKIGRIKESQGLGEAGDGRVKAKPKKRVLNQKSDNPLLRPLSRASSEILGEGSKRKGRILKAKEVNEIKEIVEKDPEILAPESEIENEEVREQRDGRTQPKRTTKKTSPNLTKSIEAEDEDLHEVTRPMNEMSTAKSQKARKVLERTRSTLTSRFESDEEDFGPYSDGLSDFIIDDSTFLDDEDTVVEAPPPRSNRRLIKGRKPTRDEDSNGEDLGLGMEKLIVAEDTSARLDEALKQLNLKDFADNYSDQDIAETKTKKDSKHAHSREPILPNDREAKKAPLPSSGVEDPFTLR
jgi:hypothetical protein